MQRGFGKYRLVYGHLWATYGQHWQVRVSWLLRLLTQISKLVVLPIALSLIITGLSRHDYASAERAVVWFVVTSLLIGIATPLTRYIGMLGENAAYHDIARTYFAKLVGADLDYFHSNLAGYLTTATRQYIDSCMILIREMRDTYLPTVLSIVFPLIVITWVDVPLGIVTLVLCAVQASYLLWGSHILSAHRSRAREVYKRNNGLMADIVSNILAVKASAQEEQRIQQLNHDMAEENILYKQRYTVQAQLISLREIMTVIFFMVLLWLTVQRMQAGAISITGAVLVVTYTTTILNGVYALQQNLDTHDDWVDKIIPAFEILNRRNTVNDPEKPQRLHKVRGKIVFDKIAFAYDKQADAQSVFSGLSLTIAAGQKVGIVGLSGAGKSTLAKLLLRFNDVDDGAVLIDDLDVRNVAQADLRRHIAYVPQEPLLFHTSIRENIKLAKPGATDAEIAAALKRAHATTFIGQLPDGVGSTVGERGVKLSGGQKQRIAIARAVLQEAPIIVLDEATSALDSESEQIIKDSFTKILRGKTAIVIAHRLSTLSEMDRIVVIENGQVAEDGTHEELLALGGEYANLWNRQQRHLDDPESVPDGADPALLADV